MITVFGALAVFTVIGGVVYAIYRSRKDPYNRSVLTPSRQNSNQRATNHTTYMSPKPYGKQVNPGRRYSGSDEQASAGNPTLDPLLPVMLMSMDNPASPSGPSYVSAPVSFGGGESGGGGASSSWDSGSSSSDGSDGGGGGGD